MIKRIEILTRLHHKVLISTLCAAASSLVGRQVNLSEKKYEEIYDLAVIGGGSGGLSTAFEASKHGLKTIVIDYVEESPSPYKTKWGLGGTCVNVGCIPKKLMHKAAQYGQELINASDYGWELPNSVNQRIKEDQMHKYFNWTRLRGNVVNHIKSINFGYTGNINSDENLDYLNALATFIDPHTLLCSKNPATIKDYLKNKQIKEQKGSFQIKAKNFVIATGTRPQYLPIEGAQLAITSDDIFMKKDPPGKTLIVGGGYVAVEIAGFLKGLGYPVSLMTRGDYLRSFDRDMVNQVINHLKKVKVNVVETSLPKFLKKNENGLIQAQIQNQITKQISTDIFDTVLFAVGRKATTHNLNLQQLGISLSKNQKILNKKPQEIEQTNFDHIYALGDVVDGLPELTSTAVKMGAALGRRIVSRVKGTQFKHSQMHVDISQVPTTIFTPLQFSTCGLSEDKAINELGRENVEVYHIKYMALEEQILDKYDEEGNSHKDMIYAKAVVDKRDNKVVGLHFTAPNAGEIMQGFAVAMKMGMKKQILDQTIGIHPTVAEKFTMMEVTKQSGLPFEKTSC